MLIAVDEMALQKLLERLAAVLGFRSKDITSKEERKHGSTRKFRIVCWPEIEASGRVVVQFVDISRAGDFEMTNIETSDFKCPTWCSRTTRESAPL